MKDRVTNVVIAGLGGQGVLKASDIIADAAFRVGLDVKKSEIHGMSQRGGSVASDVRFGERVESPMVPAGQADYLVVIAQDQVEVNLWNLADGGTLITPGCIDAGSLPNRKSLNVSLLGCLSRFLEIGEPYWRAAIRANLPERLHEMNIEAFMIGRRAVDAIATEENHA